MGEMSEIIVIIIICKLPVLIWLHLHHCLAPQWLAQRFERAKIAFDYRSSAIADR